MDGLFRMFIVIAVINHVNGGIADAITISVKTDVGTFIGTTRNVSLYIKGDKGVRASSFLGIPYAKPPVGQLRFAKPVPFGRIKSEYNATYHRPACVQSNFCYLQTIDAAQSEDCLYLNIYTPGKGDLKAQTRPVMVYIHGGSFGCGSAQAYDGAVLSGYNDVIVVVINYRLGAFGFLSDGSKMTGNYGLWDMHLALNWVHDNIAPFGGDKNAVTIFGNSAGGAAVLFQATQPLNEGLFQRVISQGGSFFGLWSYEMNPRADFENLATKTDCLAENYTETLQCLRSVNPEQLIGDFQGSYVPTIDGEFIKQSPFELLNDRDKAIASEALTFLSGLDLMVGTNTDDGAFGKRLWEFYSTQNITCGFIKSIFEVLLSDQGCKGYPPSHLKDLNALYPCNDPKYATLLMPIEILRDGMLFVPSILSAKLHSLAEERNNRGSLYYYIFGQRPSYAGSPDWLPGATHFMEVPYIFGLPESLVDEMQSHFGATYPDNISRSDVDLSSLMMELWTGFARTGIPFGKDWPQYTQDSQLYLNIHTQNIGKRRLQDYPPSKNIKTFGRILRQTDERCRPTVNSVSTLTSDITSLPFCLIAILLLLETGLFVFV